VASGIPRNTLWASTAAALALAVAPAGCGDDSSESAAGGTATPAVTATPSPTATPTATATATADALGQALWPDPASATDAEPVEVARSFVEQAIGIEQPALGAFQESEPRAGEVPVHGKGEDGTKLEQIVATISLRQLDGTRWFVTSVGSDEVEIESPEPLEEIGSPAHIAGRGRGFEGNIVLEVRNAFAPAGDEPLARKPVTAGSMAYLEPFEADLELQAPSGEAGAIYALTGSGIAAAHGFSVIPVRFR
jgi:hypothetical protein